MSTCEAALFFGPPFVHDTLCIFHHYRGTDFPKTFHPFTKTM